MRDVAPQAVETPKTQLRNLFFCAACFHRVKEFPFKTSSEAVFLARKEEPTENPPTAPEAGQPST